MKIQTPALRTIAFLLSLTLGLPTPAFALREQQEEDLSQKAILEKALTSLGMTPGSAGPLAPRHSSGQTGPRTGLEEVGRPEVPPQRRAVIFGV